MLRTSHSQLAAVSKKVTDVALGDYHYIVVGGGAAGASIACRLAQENYKTLVVEAGPDVTKATVPKWHREAPGAPILHREAGRYITKHKAFYADEEVELLTPRCLGGASVVLGSKSYVRGHQFDWGKNEVAGKPPHFPLAFEDSGMILYYKKLERLRTDDFHRGRDGYFSLSRGKGISMTHRPMLQSLQSQGIGLLHRFNPPAGFQGTGTGRVETLIDINKGTTCGPLTSHVPTTRHFRRPLTVQQGTVDSIVIEDNMAKGIVADGKMIAADRGVILAAGAVGTPQVLQRTEGLPEHVSAFVRGDTLWTVPTLNLGFEVAEESLAPLGDGLGRLAAMLEWQLRGSGWLGASWDDMVLYLETSVSRKRRNALGNPAVLEYPDVRVVMQPFMNNAAGRVLPIHGVQFKVQLIRPQGRGRVLEDGTIRLNKSEQDEEALAEAAATIQAAVDSAPNFYKAPQPVFRTFEGPHGGTCALGGIVGKATSQLEGVQRVWVADGSLVPSPLVADALPLAYALAESTLDRAVRKAPPITTIIGTQTPTCEVV